MVHHREMRIVQNLKELTIMKIAALYDIMAICPRFMLF
jgi:hypothetical protein